jgi:hypothetical protein
MSPKTLSTFIMAGSDKNIQEVRLLKDTSSCAHQCLDHGKDR